MSVNRLYAVLACCFIGAAFAMWNGIGPHGTKTCIRGSVEAMFTDCRPVSNAPR